MNLQDFIRDTLVGIALGVENAQAELKGRDVYVNPAVMRGQGEKPLAWGRRAIQQVGFDVAVTVEESVEGGSKAGIMVMGIGLGAKAEGAFASQTASRIKFEVGLILSQTDPYTPQE